MNLRFVQAFCWVACPKSISRAAEKLFLTQSAMSSRISTLGVELGARLLDRRCKQFKLKAAGVRFLSMPTKHRPTPISKSNARPKIFTLTRTLFC